VFTDAYDGALAAGLAVRKLTDDEDAAAPKRETK
jgi:hypothetical protein